MTINVNNQAADSLTRKFAEMEGVGLTEAIVIAMSEAIERRRQAEAPIDTARRLRESHDVQLPNRARTPLPKAVFDAMWDAG